MRDQDAMGTLEPGVSVAGQFRIERTLGNGSYGVVFLCTAPNGKRFALKTPLYRTLERTRTLPEFRSEVSQWIALGVHPNIVACFGLVDFLRLPFVVMEYVEGGIDLREVIKQQRTTWKEALAYGCQVTSALAYAYERSEFLHRDVKPANILIRPDGAAKVSDFGLSAVSTIEKDQTKRKPLGTAAYLAPELRVGPAKSSIESEIYSLGATLLEVAISRLYFESADEETKTVSALQSAMKQASPDMPEKMVRLLLKCLDTDPLSRPRSFTRLAGELSALCREALGYTPLDPEIADTRNDIHRSIDLAITYSGLQQHEKARRAAEDAIALDRGHWKAWLLLGNAHADQGDYEIAIECLRQAEDLNPTDIDAKVNLARTYSRLGRNRDGLKLAEIAIETAGDAGMERLEPLINVSNDIGQPDRALLLCDEILERNPKAAMVWNNRAALCRRRGDYKEALRSADRAIELNPAYAKAWVNRANALLHLRNREEAIKSAERAIKFDPCLPGAYAALATASVHSGRIDDARTCLMRGLELLPGDPLLTRGLEQLPSDD